MSTTYPASVQAFPTITAATMGASGEPHVGQHNTIGDTLEAVQTRALRRRLVTDFGATGDGTTDDTTALNNAIASGAKYLGVPAGTYNFTALTVAGNDITLELDSGATLSLQTATNKGFTVTGHRFRITGTGRILSPATFDGINTRPTYAVIWVEGDDFYASGITFENIPKVGIMFEDGTGHRVVGCKFVGNYPYASYNPATTTVHCALQYNPPPTSETLNPGVVVTGCHIQECIQGFLIGNYDGPASEAGIVVAGNVFNQCWDHGIYTTLGEGHAITGNTFLNCKVPIVTSGTGCTVTGNALYANETVQMNGQQVISVRDGIGCVIANNSIYGLCASIAVDCINGTVLRDNIIANNTIRSTGSGFSSFAIRLGLDAQTSERNKIVGNIIHAGHTTEFGGAIIVEMDSGSYQGQNNEILNNTVYVTNKCFNIHLLHQTGAIVRGNVMESVATAGSAGTTIMLMLEDLTDGVVEDNTFLWRTGGTNLTVRGIQDDGVGANNRLHRNRFLLTSGSLAGSDPIGFATADFYKSANQISTTSAMGGTFTWTTGTSSHVVTNANVTTGSRIFVAPVDADAGVVIQGKGFYVTPGTGSFTIATGDGTNTAAASDWAYQIG